MRNIYLHGALKKHGEKIPLNVETASEAVSALVANFPEFMDDIRAGSWVIMRGDPKTGMALDEEAVAGMRLGDADLHIMPEIGGAKSGDGAVKAILGATLVALSFGTAAFLAQPISGAVFGSMTWGNAVGQLGFAMALSGVSTMLAPQQNSASSDDKNYTMTGPTTRQGQGYAIQIVYGEVITGGMLISGGIDADNLQTITPGAT